jgi:hypothetical protein
MTGDFVHVTFAKMGPLDLRGVGPLQLCGAASSVSVEAQEWAANFFASGGYPSVVLKSEVELDEVEAANLKRQWIETPPNMPKVTNPGMELQEFGANPQGAQMMQARDYQNGDAARMFGIPGSLLDYSTPGSSLTYQNLEGEFGKFVRGCLAPNYLSPIEQALTDLLPRAVVARFYVDGLLRADVKTRYEVYASGITSGVLTVDEARTKEGLAPGNVELAPVSPAMPAATPASLPIPRTAMEVRCDGRMVKRRAGIPSVESCHRLLTRGEPFVGKCPRCGKLYPEAAPGPSDELMAFRMMSDNFAAMANREHVVNIYPAPAPPPAVTNVSVNPTPIHVDAAAVTVNPTPVEVRNDVTVNPTPVEVHNAVEVNPTPLKVEVKAPAVTVVNEMPKASSVKKRIVRDKGLITEIIEETTDG